ncbi:MULTISPECIES: hypothetical protein [unclassified Clostridium]|uniref:hypothetical protein n=1 Tax=unclassified Clostridium TaxID=2614128 RepID=UPI0025B7CFCD|nr:MULTISPECIES: hypothetical protein [unclassified Clostridium]
MTTQNKNIFFEEKELRWIKELIKDKINEMKRDGDYDFFTYDKEIFESILSKIENS